MRIVIVGAGIADCDINFDFSDPVQLLATLKK